MAGPNKPPKEGSREQLERDNQTYLYVDKPFSEQGGTVGEAEADIPGLDDAIEAAMKDADPQAYAQGLREEAAISSSRVFAAGSLIAALGRDMSRPETQHTEPTNQATDYTPYGHDSNLQSRIGNEHMAGSAEGKIAGTIGAQKADEYYIEEKKRKEDEGYAMYVAATAAAAAAEDAWDAWDFWDDNSWYDEPEMSYDQYSAMVDTFAGENDAFTAAADAAIQSADQYLTVDAPQTAADIAALQGTHVTVMDTPQAPGTSDADRAAADASTDRLLSPNANIYDQMRNLNSASTRVFQDTTTVYSAASSYFGDLVRETQAFRDRIPTMSVHEMRYELTQDLRETEQRIRERTPEQAKQDLIAEMRHNLKEAETSGDTQAQQMWQTRLDNAMSLTGEQAQQLMLEENQNRRAQIASMSESQLRNAIQNQANAQVDFALQAQRQMTGMAGSVEQGRTLTTELERLTAEYARRDQEFIRNDGVLSEAESEQQAQLLEEINRKRAELDAYNQVAIENSQRIRDDMAMASNNFMLGRKVNERGQADQLVTSIEDLQNSQIAQGEAASDAAATLQQAQTAAADARAGYAPGMQYNGGGMARWNPGLSTLSREQQRDLRQEITTHHTNNTMTPEAIQALALKYGVAGESVQRMADWVTGSGQSLNSEQRENLRNDIAALSASNQLNADSVRDLAARYGVAEQDVQRRVEFVVGAGPEITALERDQRHALRDEIAALSPAGALTAQGAAQLAEKYGVSQQGVQQYANFLSASASPAAAVGPAGPPVQTPQAVELTGDACFNYNTLERNEVGYDESIFNFLNQDGASPSAPSTVSIFGSSPSSCSVMPVTPIADAGYTGSPLMDTSNGILGGSYSSFADNEFNETNPTAQETGGYTPSYSRPWYSTAWDATSSFMSSIWSGLDSKPATPGVGGQQPAVMLASNDPNAPGNRVTPVAGAGAGGGAMA